MMCNPVQFQKGLSLNEFLERCGARTNAISPRVTPPMPENLLKHDL